MDGTDSFWRKLLFLPEQASTIAAEIDALHYAVIGITMLGTMAITAVAAVFCIRYRSRRPYQPDRRPKPAPTPPLWLEVTSIAGLFALFVAFWGVGFWQFVRLQEPPAGSYDIYVTGKQWMWKFAYPTGHHTINALYVPAGRPIRLIMTSRDVIHSFFVPEFRIKQDVVPGRYMQVWFTAPRPRTHRILCTEYCGTEHSRMLGEVVVLAAADFERWLIDESEGGGPADPRLLSEGDVDAPLHVRGESVAAKYGCLRCHTLDGSPHIGPSWAGVYGATIQLETGETAIADVAYLTEAMMDPLAKLHRGYAPVMPSYRGYLEPAEVSALVELIKSLEHVEARPVAPLAAPERGVYSIPDLQPALPAEGTP